MKSIYKIFTILLMVILFTGCSKEEDTIIMVTESGFAPYEYQSGNEVVGVDVDIAKEIAKALKKKLIIRDVAFDSIINELNAGKADFAAAGLSITEERKKNVDFSIEYAASKQVIVVRNNYNGIKHADDLKNKIVAVQLGSVADSYLSEEYPNATIMRQKKFLAAAEDVKASKADAIVMDELPAKELVKQNPELRILDVELFTDRYAIAVKKGNEKLLNEINSVLEELMDEGKIDEFVLNHSYKAPEKSTWLSGIADSFYQTVIYDGRWKLIFEGLRNTLMISIGALIVGIVFGSLISIARYTNKQTGKFKITTYLCEKYVTIIRGTPAVLQLMIMYYIIFKSSNISSVIIGIISFGLNSAAYVSEILRSGFESINDGQVEAGLSLGLTFKKTLRHIILPQAVKNSLPAMGNEFITLIKETAIVGYIGITDLTKASDIIASRTYDYFFPLILVALIYLTMTSLLSRLLKKVERKLDVS